MELIEIIVTIIGIAAATALGVFQFQNKVSLRRERLKHDLEMLKLSKELKWDTAEFENDLKLRFKTFEKESTVKRKTPFSEEYIGATISSFAIFIGLTVWTIYLLKDGFTWWGVLTGWIALSMLSAPFFTFISQTQDAKKVNKFEKDDKP